MDPYPNNPQFYPMHGSMETTRPDGDSEDSPLIRLPGGGDLVAFGGDLKPERLLEMYRSGIFPWYEEDSPILWWSPDPRAILSMRRLAAGTPGLISAA